MENRTVKNSIRIKAPVSTVWKAITDPATIKEYFFDTDVESDWKKGSPITYSGTWQGKDYKDKGIIEEVEKEKLLRHTHWSSLSGIPDIPENYFTITYDLEPKSNETILNVTQAGLMSKETAEHSGENWKMVLQKLKELLEGK